MINFLQAEAVQQPGMGSFWIMMLLMVAVMYFFMWRNIIIGVVSSFVMRNCFFIISPWRILPKCNVSLTPSCRIEWLTSTVCMLRAVISCWLVLVAVCLLPHAPKHNIAIATI